MYLWIYLQRILRQLHEIKIRILFQFCIIHFAISYFGFVYFQENKLTESLGDYFYYWVVTSSTIGYGDMSPQGTAGRVFAAVFMIPFSLILFGISIAKSTEYLKSSLKKERLGMKDYSSMKNHTIIIGYHPTRTSAFVSLLRKKSKEDNIPILLVTDQQIEHPFLMDPDVKFCAVRSLRSQEDAKRFNPAAARQIIIDSTGDDANFVLATLYSSWSPSSHISTYIADEVTASSLQNCCKNVDVVADYREEIMIRTLEAMGSNRLFSELLSPGRGQTIHTCHFTLPKKVKFSQLSTMFANQNSILLGIADNEYGTGLRLNPQRDDEFEPGVVLFFHYLSEKQLNCMDVFKNI